MIQRIQSIFLFMVIIFMVLFLFLPFWRSAGVDSGNWEELYSLYKLNYSDEGTVAVYWPFMISGILGALSIIIAIIEIFSYKVRMTQIKLGALNSLVIAGALGASVIFATDLQNDLINGEPGKYMFGLFLPVLSIFANLLANRFIRKDEDLVRSMDRIR